ncbi:type IV secretion system DNA-binding domain-containing protein [Metallibacterium sp.]|uniref:type IV secretion system DNA-binding domain-containing protein n=1 Tax=Metallibacterium sp. TaxID=2940281 RepID=UPI002614075E|nr:type IV secretion system DNA-binding domain-containing protein [Metallibacterium sp.]
MSESVFRIELIIVLALAGFVGGLIIGNRLEWRRLLAAQVPVVHQFETGAVLMKMKACGIPKAPHWIAQRCATYNELFAAPASRDYLIPRMQRALIWWPIGMAAGVVLLGMVGLALKSAKFRKLDEHAARDWFKARKMPMVMDSIAVIATLLGLVAAIYTRRMEWLVLASGGLIALWLELGRLRRKFRHIRGARIEDAEEVERLIRRQYKKRLGGLEIGGVPIPRDFEVLNFLIAGAPGTGKSTAIAPMIKTMRERGDRVFVADARGDYLRRFYRPGDLILNPRDKRSVPWSPLSEIHAPEDAAAIARSLIPDGEGRDANWHRFAQQLLEGVLLHALQQALTNADVARLMRVASRDELRERLSGTPADGLLSEKSDSQMFGDIRSTASPYTKALGWLTPDAGAQAFSLRRWARDEKQTAACWWNYQDAQIVALKTLIATQLDLLALGVLEQPDSHDRRTWLIVDELSALSRIGTLEDFLARARKAGGAAVLGVQTLAQLRREYGEHSASAIIACCSSLLALALGDVDSQEYVSKLFGEQEQSVVTRSSSQSDAASQQTVQRTLRTERVLMPAELSPGQLKRWRGFVRLPEVPIAPVRIDECQFADVAPRFVPREVAPGPAAEPAADDSPAAPGGGAGVAVPPPAAPELPQLAAGATPEDLLQHLEARRQAGWRENQKQDAAGSHQEAGAP